MTNNPKNRRRTVKRRPAHKSQEHQPSDQSSLSRTPTAPIDPTLISNFTHQIINPLNAVIGTLSNFVDGTTPQDRRHQKTKAVISQIDHVIELVRNLEYLGKLSTDTGRKSLREKAQPLSVPAVAIEAVQFFQVDAERRGIKIELPDSITQYMIRGHSHLLRQVFINILENYVKYAFEDSKISIATSVHTKKKELRVDIEGRGPQINPEERERIFGLGFRGSAAMKLNASGSGIGLYIARQITEDILGGEISVLEQASPTVFRLSFTDFWIDHETTDEFMEIKR